MIGSLFAHFRSHFAETPEPSEDTSSEQADSSEPPSFLESLPLVRRISLNRTACAGESDAAEISQLVALRLFKWKEKYGERAAKMSREDWDKFAAKATINEVNRHFSSLSRSREVAIDEALGIECDSPEGDSICELMSLTKVLWQDICLLTLRQRRALLLHSRQLVRYLQQAEISDAELAASVEMNVDDWLEALPQLPIGDLEIAERFRSSGDLRPLSYMAKAVKKARFDARKKLEGFRNGVR